MYNISFLFKGRGNSAFETAQAIYDRTNYVHMIGRHRIRLAWETHYVGDIRYVFDIFYKTKRVFILMGGKFLYIALLKRID